MFKTFSKENNKKKREGGGIFQNFSVTPKLEDYNSLSYSPKRKQLYVSRNTFRENMFRENMFRENMFRENMFRGGTGMCRRPERGRRFSGLWLAWGNRTWTSPAPLCANPHAARIFLPGVLASAPKCTTCGGRVSLVNTFAGTSPHNTLSLKQTTQACVISSALSRPFML